MLLKAVSPLNTSHDDYVKIYRIALQRLCASLTFYDVTTRELRKDVNTKNKFAGKSRR